MLDIIGLIGDYSQKNGEVCVMTKAMDSVETITLRGERIAENEITEMSIHYKQIKNKLEYADKTEKEKIKYFIDLDNSLIGYSVIKSRTIREMNAFFYQLNELKSEYHKKDSNKYEDRIESVDLVYIDFKDIIKDSSAIESVFSYGIILKDKEKYRRMIPFDKSASMSRKSVITFIDESIKDDMDKRLTLGIFDHKKKKPYPLSKVFSYRGLYLSSGIRVDEAYENINESDGFVLNEKSVVIVPDVISNTRDTDVTVFTELAADSDNKYGKVKYKKRGQGFEVNCYDGEGLISPDYSIWLGKYLLNKCMRNADKATSFQIRLPFGKGMLHSVDFIAFFRDELNIDTDNGYILDYYGINRKISEIKIILTTSMFKAYKWIEKSFDKNDPMKDYFERFHKYNHAMYVLRTDKSLYNPGVVNLNYQFLNTGNLKKEQFDNLIAKSLNYTKLLMTDKEKQREFLINCKMEKTYDNEADNSDDSEKDDENNISDEVNATRGIRSLLCEYPELIGDVKIQGKINAIVRSQISNAMRGNLIIRGENRFLSGDLLSLLKDVAHRYIVNEKKNRMLIYYINKERIKEKKNTTSKSAMSELYKEYSNNFYKKYSSQKLRYHEKHNGENLEDDIKLNMFYAPQNEDSGIDYVEDKDYAILRNPHLSRNEQCAMRPYLPKSDDNLYKKYLGHLAGVVMFPYGSPDAERLSGADFDGDMVKIIDDDMFNKSARDCYLNLPLVQIPHGKEKEKYIPERLSYDYIKDGFDTQVGLLSNQAIKFGLIEYNENLDSIIDSNKKDEMIKKKAALLDEAKGIDYAAASCIAVGKEIDKAKTGEAPDTRDLTEMGKGLKSDFLDKKRELSSYKFKDPKIVEKDGEIAKFEYINNSKKSQNMLIIKPKEGESNLESIMFSVLFAWNRIKEDIKNEKASNGANTKSYIFKSADRSLGSTELYYLFALKMIAYNYIIKKALKINRLKKRYMDAPYRSYVNTIVRFQYDIGKEKIDDYTIDEAVEASYMVVDSLGDGNRVREILKTVIDEKWHYTAKENREAVLDRLLEKKEGKQCLIEEDNNESYSKEISEKDIQVAKKILSNFECKGYNILYYILKDVIAQYTVKRTFDDGLQSNQDKDSSTSKMLKELIKDRYIKFHNTIDKNKFFDTADYIMQLLVYKLKDSNECDNAITLLEGMNDDYFEDNKENIIHDKILKMQNPFKNEQMNNIDKLNKNMLIELIRCQQELYEIFWDYCSQYESHYRELDNSKRNVDESGIINNDLIKKKMLEYYRRDIEAIFADANLPFEKTLDYWLALRTKYDLKHDLLWDVYSNEEIKRIIRSVEIEV